MKPVIQLRTLGGVSLSGPAGEELQAAVAQPKRLALLAYLARANSSGFRRRDTVLALFWPELDQAHARGALRQALRFLRRALGDGVIVTRGEEEVGVDGAALWCDATAFVAACDAEENAAAIALYHGHFLDGLYVADAAAELDHWLEAERKALRLRAVAAARDEAERCRLAGDTSAALTALRRSADLAPDDETAQARLIALLDATGDRVGALEAYDRLSERLRREYEVAPAPETQRLIKQIRARERPLAPAVAEPADAPPPDLAREQPAATGWTGRRWRGPLLGAAAAALAVAVAIGGARQRAEVIPAALTLAVIPPAPAEADTALARLGRDLSITLSATLDGVGGIRAVDPSAILAHSRGAPHASVTRAAAALLGRKLGAGSVVHGQLSRIGSAVRVELGLFTTDSLRPLAHASVTVQPGDLGAVSDSLSWILLRQLWRRDTAPTPSLAAVTTRSIPALRAFLEGEQAVVQNRWRAAAQAYREAIETDSAFILAEFRYALAQFWQEEEVDSATLAHLAARRGAVPERDRLLIDAWLALKDSAMLTLQRYGEVTRRFPDYWPGWLLYGDFLFHFGPMNGIDVAETIAALSRAADLNPGLVPAWHHLILAAAAYDPAVAMRARDRLHELGWLSGSPAGAGPLERPLLELVAALAVDEAAAAPRRSRLMDSVAQIVAALPDNDQAASDAPLCLLQAGFPAAQIALNRRVLGFRISPIAAARQHRAIAWAWATRGAWDSAGQAMEEVAVDPTGRSAEDRYVFAIAAAWVGAGPAEEAVHAGRAAREAMRRAPPDRQVFVSRRLTWFDGVLAYLRRDGDALAQAVVSAAQPGSSQDSLMWWSLVAFRQALSGDLAAAAREIVRQEQYCLNQKECGIYAPNMAVQRSAAIDWLLATGDTATALSLMGWQESGQLGWHFTMSLAMGSLQDLARARIEEARGETRLAQRDYDRFLRRFDRPIPALSYLVREAEVGRTRVAAREPPTGIVLGKSSAPR